MLESLHMAALAGLDWAMVAATDACQAA
ncbi:hypothetical protein SSE37_01450 [Sagittula stellata E-37]|uniref:Uncharacterized protein n=1 Tax=Sagittula stellata (strain ATCC 700073 / DSM 11524 / E-37) TaxID=388399 RepID=A3K4H8_SAGS3|nr:hypothetical protein SSE37_01450 [Sagittula stellata E-37]